MKRRVWLVLAMALFGCDERRAMHSQPRLHTMAPGPFFPDGVSLRPFVEGTVPRSGPATTLADAPPPPLSLELVQRGQERFNIFCSVCHGRDGFGNGMVVQRGFPQAASYHADRLREATDDYVFGVITNGLRAMPAYGPVVPPADRWAIVAYVRALQLTQNARIDGLPDDLKMKLSE